MNNSCGCLFDQREEEDTVPVSLQMGTKQLKKKKCQKGGGGGGGGKGQGQLPRPGIKGLSRVTGT